ncbi:MAG: hypothetical protein ACYSUI_12105 [Planctomycetota bacterium]|jgi:hypothetical protein
MSRLKRLVVEAHQRSLWQALLVYLGASFAVLEAADLLIERFGLPEWLFPVAFALLVVGLPVVVVVSLARKEVYGDEVPEEHAEEAAAEDRRLRFLTWRTAGFAFVGALAVWGVALSVWVLAGGSGFLFFRAGAAGLVKPHDYLVVAEFENQTESPYNASAVRLLVITDLAQSGHVYVVGDRAMREALTRMRLPDTTRVDEPLALEVARRENSPVVVSGTVASLGTGYVLSAAISDVRTREVVVQPFSETADSDSAVIPAA